MGLPDLIGRLDRCPVDYVTAVVTTMRGHREVISVAGIENLLAAVDQEAIVITVQYLVGSLALPNPLDDVSSIQYVPEAESHRAGSMRSLERLERWYQFTLGTPGHVINQN